MKRPLVVASLVGSFAAPGWVLAAVEAGDPLERIGADRAIEAEEAPSRHLRALRKEEECTAQCDFEYGLQGQNNPCGGGGGSSLNCVATCHFFPASDPGRNPQLGECQSRCLSYVEAQAAIAEGGAECGMCRETPRKGSNCL